MARLGAARPGSAGLGSARHGKEPPSGGGVPLAGATGFDPRWTLGPFSGACGGARLGRARPGLAGHGVARPGWARPGWAWQGHLRVQHWSGDSPQVRFLGGAWPHSGGACGWARPGTARLGAARLGMAGHGRARQGTVFGRWRLPSGFSRVQSPAVVLPRLRVGHVHPSNRNHPSGGFALAGFV